MVVVLMWPRGCREVTTVMWHPSSVILPTPTDSQTTYIQTFRPKVKQKTQGETGPDLGGGTADGEKKAGNIKRKEQAEHQRGMENQNRENNRHFRATTPPAIDQRFLVCAT